MNKNIQPSSLIKIMQQAEPCLFHNSEANLMPVKYKNMSLITATELASIKLWAKGYVCALVQHDKMHEGYDEFYSYSDNWDLNIHMVGKDAQTIYVVAYPQKLDNEGYIQTDTSKWVEVSQYNFNEMGKWSNSGNNKHD